MLLIAGIRPICSSGPLGARSERLMSYKVSLPNRDARVIKLAWMGDDRGKDAGCNWGQRNSKNEGKRRKFEKLRQLRSYLLEMK